MSTTKRVSMTLPKSLIEDLDFISRNLQITRSGLVSEMLTGNLSQFRSYVEQVISVTSQEPVTLSRNPDKVRSYLEALNQTVDSAKSEYDKESAALLHSLEGLKNEH